MRKLELRFWIFVAVLTLSVSALAQEQRYQPKPQENGQVPIDTQMTLDAAPPIQKPVIRSIIYLECKKANRKGTAFIVSGGIVVTAAHVVCGCGAADLTAQTALGQPVEFSVLVRDEDRDLAALRPKTTLQGGLELAPAEETPPGERVNTWGYPLIYNGPAPLLSVGYVSGYYQAGEDNFCDPTQNAKNVKFKHIVVNGGFNPGNSGGPLFVFGQSKVIGVVIWKRIAFSNQVQVAIDGFHSPHGASLGGRFSERQADGTSRGISDEEVIARVLEEFYNKVQVDIGEAVSASELRKFLKEKAVDLSSPN
jgi:S1-C subfamily serine protease